MYQLDPVALQILAAGLIAVAAMVGYGLARDRRRPRAIVIDPSSRTVRITKLAKPINGVYYLDDKGRKYVLVNRDMVEYTVEDTRLSLDSELLRDQVIQRIVRGVSRPSRQSMLAGLAFFVVGLLAGASFAYGFSVEEHGKAAAEWEGKYKEAKAQLLKCQQQLQEAQARLYQYNNDTNSTISVTNVTEVVGVGG